MVAIKSDELQDNFKDVCELALKGETVIVSRPNNQKVVVLSEYEYNIREKAFRNQQYLAKIEDGIKSLKEGKGISFTIEELEKFETMTEDEAKQYVENKKMKRETRA